LFTAYERVDDGFAASMEAPQGHLHLYDTE